MSTAVHAAASTDAAAESHADQERSAVQAANTTLPADTTLPTVRLPVDARGAALAILATVALVGALQWAQSFVISLLLGILFAYMLNPLVAWLEKIKVPRVAGTLVVMLAVVGALVLGVYSLRGQMQNIVEQLPEAATRFSAAIVHLRGDQFGNMQKVQTAASEVEKAASQAAGVPSPQKQAATHVIVDKPGFKLGAFLWEGSMGVLGFVGQALMVVFLVFFLLLAGDTFKRKLVRLTGPTLSKKKITVTILDDINRSIQQYMVMLLTTNVLVGLLAWIAFHWMGLDNAGAWAVAAGMLHVIPYFGPALTAGAVGMAAFMQFDSFSMALLAAGTSVAIATLVGTFIATWMTGKIAKMNAAAIFISLLFWGWLWGVWGLLLSIPIIVIVKVVSQHVEQLQPVAELLGE
jgi:predicted PurR-regulated permease PerM